MKTLEEKGETLRLKLKEKTARFAAKLNSDVAITKLSAIERVEKERENTKRIVEAEKLEVEKLKIDRDTELKMRNQDIDKESRLLSDTGKLEIEKQRVNNEKELEIRKQNIERESLFNFNIPN